MNVICPKCSRSIELEPETPIVKCGHCHLSVDRRRLGGATNLAHMPLVRDLRGKTIGGYRIGRLIGIGGTGVVYLAGTAAGGETVAFKAVHYDFLHRARFLRGFKTEVARWANLDHPNIVRVLDAGRQGEIYYLVLEYIDGIPVDQYIQANQPKLKEIRSLIEQVGAALTYAHAQNILHRNLKPANILVAQGQIKMTDFGLAHLTSGDYRQTLLVRTDPAHESFTYMAPELRFKETSIDERTDVFSCGALLYHLLTEYPPVGLIYPPSRLNPQLPRKYDSYILAALEPEPDERPDSIGDLVKPFRLSGWHRKSTDNRNPFRVILLILAVIALSLYLWIQWPAWCDRLPFFTGVMQKHRVVATGNTVIPDPFKPARWTTTVRL